MATLPTYNVTPSPQAGAGAYGAVPGAIAIPPSTWDQLDVAAPGLTGLTPTALAYTGAAMRGQLTTPEQKMLQDAAAAWGVGQGQPLVSPYGITTNKWDTSRLLAMMNREKQGLADYQSLLKDVGALQTPQTLAADIAARNATMGAAPNPAAAFQAMLDAWMTKFQATQAAAEKARGPITTPSTGTSPWQRTTASPPIVGGPAAGTGIYSRPTTPLAGTLVAGSTATGTNIGGVTYPEGKTPDDVYAAWKNLASTWGIPTDTQAYTPWDALGKGTYGDLWPSPTSLPDIDFTTTGTSFAGIDQPGANLYDFYNQSFDVQGPGGFYAGPATPGGDEFAADMDYWLGEGAADYYLGET